MAGRNTPASNCSLAQSQFSEYRETGQRMENPGSPAALAD